VVEKLPNREAFEWIPKSLERGTHRVTSLVPPGYRRYCKIMHPIFEDTSLPRENLNETDTNAQYDQKRQWAVWHMLSRDSSLVQLPYRRVTWRELARRHGVPYDERISWYSSFYPSVFRAGRPKHLLGIVGDSLDRHTCSHIVTVLEPFTGEQDCYFDYLLTYPYEGQMWRTLRGRLSEVITTLDDELARTPTYWWPEDRSWCQCTDYDLDFTAVGGSDALIDAFVQNPHLECLLVSVDDIIF